MKAQKNQLDHVRDYFDFDAVKYQSQRYPEEPKTCDQYSYIIRKKHVLDMLDHIFLGKGKILDIGCGPGIYTRDLLQRGWEVWAMDISPRMLEMAKQSISDIPEANRSHFISGQVESLSFDDSFFDAVICIGVIPYVNSLEKTISEILRVLKPGGCVIFQLSNRLAPFKIEDFLKRFVKFCLRIKQNQDEDDLRRDQIRIAHHNPYRFDQLCRANGFHVLDFRYYDFRTPVVTSLLPSLALVLGKRLEFMDRSRVSGLLGNGYLVTLKKTDLMMK